MPNMVRVEKSGEKWRRIVAVKSFTDPISYLTEIVRISRIRRDNNIELTSEAQTRCVYDPWNLLPQGKIYHRK